MRCLNGRNALGHRSCLILAALSKEAADSLEKTAEVLLKDMESQYVHQVNLSAENFVCLLLGQPLPCGFGDNVLGTKQLFEQPFQLVPT